MTGPDAPQRERLAELVIERALHGSTPEQDAEMRQLSGALGVWDDGSFERAASAVLVAGLPAPLEPMPAHLYARLVDTAAPAAQAGVSSTPKAPARSSSSMALRTGLAVSGWLAAATFLVIAAWALKGRAPEPVAVVPPTESAQPAPVASTASVAKEAKEKEPTPADRRTALLASAKDVVRLDWKPGKDATGAAASGDVVWSPNQQRGFMRLSGLRPNDPKVSQYQLWIFDKGRDAKYPVDGGVFDVGADGELVVPIEAKLHVDAPTLFAVTVERPGGVVVSDRKRIAILASAG
jgi:anti-sigma-K factor RskA